MTNFEYSYLVLNLYYDYGERLNKNIVLNQLGHYSENNIIKMINFMQFIEVVEKYSVENSDMNNLPDDQMDEILIGINILNNKNYELTF